MKVNNRAKVNNHILMSGLGRPTILGHDGVALGETLGDESDDVVVGVDLLQQLLSKHSSIQ